MNLRNFLLCTLLFAISCTEKMPAGQFKVEGNILQAENQQVFIEQLFFSDKNPEVLDTANMVKGKFTLEAIASEEGLFRIRFEKLPNAYLLINDQPVLHFTANASKQDLLDPVTQSPANGSLKGLLIRINDIGMSMQKTSSLIDSLKKNPGQDSLLAVQTNKLNGINQDAQQYILHLIDTAKSPVLAMFAAGYTQNIDPESLKKIIPDMAKRFPKHEGVTMLVKKFEEMITAQKTPVPAAPSAVTVGSQAPNLTMKDPMGKDISINDFKGKYVLVDFWASWCGPCRRENPNVVAAYKKFQNKNFTVLGVSLDEDKEAWLKAIKDDQLVWQQMSDLKGWSSAAVPAYGFDGIPFNVLLNPEGKIIATGLRDQALHDFLTKIVK